MSTIVLRSVGSFFFCEARFFLNGWSAGEGYGAAVCGGVAVASVASTGDASCCFSKEDASAVIGDA